MTPKEANEIRAAVWIEAANRLQDRYESKPMSFAATIKWMRAKAESLRAAPAEKPWRPGEKPAGAVR